MEDSGSDPTVSYSQGSLWYWHIDRDDSPWYPPIQLFRQPAFDDWGSVMRQAAVALETMTRPKPEE